MRLCDMKSGDTAIITSNGSNLVSLELGLTAGREVHMVQNNNRSVIVKLLTDTEFKLGFSYDIAKLIAVELKKDRISKKDAKKVLTGDSE